MIRYPLLNPGVLSLLARIRHTNTLVIADRGFPYWPQIETIDLSLVDDIPTVFDVLRAIVPNFTVGAAWMAEEFNAHNNSATQQLISDMLRPVSVTFEPHTVFKTRVPGAIGLIRTGGTSPYSNIILESA